MRAVRDEAFVHNSNDLPDDLVQGTPCQRADLAISFQPLRRLIAPDRRFGASTEVTVDGNRFSIANKEILAVLHRESPSP